MELEKELKVYSYFTVDMDPDKLSKIQNAMQLARQNTLPGQVMYIPVAPGIAFRYAPESNGVGKKGLAPPSLASDALTKEYVDKQHAR